MLVEKKMDLFDFIVVLMLIILSAYFIVNEIR